MELEKRAFYNLLRINYLADPYLAVEPWQVQDWRSVELALLFEQLKLVDLNFDRTSFAAAAEEVDSPEEMSEILFFDKGLEEREKEYLYLVVFELWRRLIPERPCLSIFCDQLDHQIFLYDNNHDADSEDLQDALANLQMILDENTDQGCEIGEVFQAISNYCAHDIGLFLYDYISEQVDNDHLSYAQELLEGFQDYLPRDHWLELLHIRLLFHSDPKTAQEQLQKLVAKTLKEPDLSFLIELLAFLSQEGGSKFFAKIAHKVLHALETEEDLEDMLTILLEYFRYQESSEQEKLVMEIIGRHNAKRPEDPVSLTQADGKILESLIKAL